MIDRLDRGRVTVGTFRYPVEGGMLETAENLRRQYNIPRQEQDEYSLRSHQRAVAAWNEGRFDAETVPVPVPAARGEGTTFARDEHRETRLSDPGRLRVFTRLTWELGPSRRRRRPWRGPDLSFRTWT